MTKPADIVLDEKDAKALRELGAKQEAVQQFVRTVQMQGEQRMAELQVQGKQVWHDIAHRYSLNMEQTTYGLSNDGKRLVAIAERYNNE